MEDNGLVRVEPMRGELMAELVAAARADQHSVQCPSHVVLKRGEIVGYVSLGRMPMMLPWLDTQRVRGRDTLFVLNLCENLVGCAGPGMVLCVPCVASSPLRPYLDRVGYAVSKEAVNLGFKKVS